MNKDLIQQRFGKNLGTYNENAKVQKIMAERLLSFLDKDEYKSILEIGCGTGLLTECAVNKLRYNSYTANDIVSDCEKYIAEINSDIKFVECDAEEYSTNEKYDLIISNAVFQWVNDIEKLTERLFSMLNDGGVLLFSTFGKENFREIYHVSGETLNYLSPNEYKNILKNYNITAEEEIRIMAFKTPKDILKHLHSTGVNSLTPKAWTKKDMQSFENGYNNFCSNRPTLTYNPIYIKITK